MSAEPVTRMVFETREAHAAVARQLAANDAIVTGLARSLRAQPPRFIVTCARGSSDHAATFAKYVLETQVGLFTATASPSVSSVYAAHQNLDGALYLAISQSGKSPDLVHHAQSARVAGARVRVVALVNDDTRAGTLALRRGLNPDVPPHLRKETETV